VIRVAIVFCNEIQLPIVVLLAFFPTDVEVFGEFSI